MIRFIIIVCSPNIPIHLLEIFHFAFILFVAQSASDPGVELVIAKIGSSKTNNTSAGRELSIPKEREQCWVGLVMSDLEMCFYSHRFFGDIPTRPENFVKSVFAVDQGGSCKGLTNDNDLVVERKAGSFTASFGWCAHAVADKQEDDSAGRGTER